MIIFDKVMNQNMMEVIPKLKGIQRDFYLGGGTALALQLGHRVSVDLDFFSATEFDTEKIIQFLNLSHIHSSYKNTIHCTIDNVPITFRYYNIPLIEQKIIWHDLSLAHVNDVIAEKFKTVSQRGAKKDFCDLYASFQLYCSIEEGCRFFMDRFKDTGLNFYAALKSLTYFDDADHDPDPIWFDVDFSTRWNDIKMYFTENVRVFERHLIRL